MCDMGIAKLKEASQATMTTIHRGPTGTYPYMSPEMFGESHRGKPVDVYAFGCLCIELFGGKRLYKDLTPMQIMKRVCGNPGVPPDTSELRPEVASICDMCCQLQPDNRPLISTVVEQIRALT